MIRKALDEVDEYDFGLEDRFCDAQDLKIACSDMCIPEPVVGFLVTCIISTLTPMNKQQ